MLRFLLIMGLGFREERPTVYGNGHTINLLDRFLLIMKVENGFILPRALCRVVFGEPSKRLLLDSGYLRQTHSPGQLCL